MAEPSVDAAAAPTQPYNPLVSIVLPTLNGSRYIAQAIASCLAQTYPHFELIVVDGGSTDSTLAIVDSFNDPRVRVIRQSDNSDRLPGALNAGFAQAVGEYYTWTQDDDYFQPEALAFMVTALAASPDVAMVYTGFHFVDEHGQALRAAEMGAPEGLWQSNVVGHCFLYRRAVAEQIGPYSPDHLMAEDFQYWVRIYRRGRLQYLPGAYYAHRLHGHSLTVRDYGRYQSLRVEARARHEILGSGVLAYQRQLAAAYVEEAFAAYGRRDLAHLRRCLAAGLLRNPGWLRNRGVASLAWQSVVGFKDRAPHPSGGQQP